MIFQTKKLTQLKQLQAIIIKSHPEIYNHYSKSFQHSKSQFNKFSQLVQNIGIQWMRVFISITEQWINSSCQKFLNLLNTLQGIDEYSTQSELNNTCLYLEEIKYKFLTSLQNMKNLYLVFPQYSHTIKKSSLAKQQMLGQKKRSSSIKSLQRQRSKSKGRKLSFFTKKSEPPNLFQTFLKDKSNLNKTIKKVKKQQNSAQSAQFYKTYSNFNQNKESSFCQNKQNNKDSLYTINNNVANTSSSYNLKKSIEQKLLSSTFSSSFTQKLSKQTISTFKIQKKINQQKIQTQICDKKSDNAINFKNQMSEFEKKLNSKIDLVLKQIKQTKEEASNKEKTSIKSNKTLQNKILQESQKSKKNQISQAIFKEKNQQQNQERQQRKSQLKKSTSIGLKDNSIIKSNKDQNKISKRESKHITSFNSKNGSRNQSQTQLESIDLSNNKKQQKHQNKEIVKIQKSQNELQSYLIKTKLEKQIQNYQKATNKFALPINKSFLGIFSNKYKQFCQINKFQTLQQIIKNSNTDILPQNEQIFIIESLQKLQKMLKMKLNEQKRQKLISYTKDFISCMKEVYLKLKKDLKKQTIIHKMELISKLCQKN